LHKEVNKNICKFHVAGVLWFNESNSCSQGTGKPRRWEWTW